MCGSDVGVFPIGKDWRQYEGQAEEVLAERLAGWQENHPDVAVRRRLECDPSAGTSRNPITLSWW